MEAVPGTSPGLAVSAPEVHGGVALARIGRAVDAPDFLNSIFSFKDDGDAGAHRGDHNEFLKEGSFLEVQVKILGLTVT